MKTVTRWMNKGIKDREVKTSDTGTMAASFDGQILIATMKLMGKPDRSADQRFRKDLSASLTA